MELSTNALIAMLRALAHEVNQVEALLSMSEEGEEMGLYLNDLQEAISSVADTYSSRKQQDESLSSVDLLLTHFSKEQWPPIEEDS
jgi:hypothetical protein